MVVGNVLIREDSGNHHPPFETSYLILGREEFILMVKRVSSIFFMFVSSPRKWAFFEPGPL